MYPQSLGDMKSTYLTDFPEEFLFDLNANTDGDEIKLIRSSIDKNSK